MWGTVRACAVFLFAGAILLASAFGGMPQEGENRRNEMEQAEPNSLSSDPNITITVVYDNNPYKEGLGTAWGFSCVVTGMEKTILFDTGGDGRLLLENMSKMAADANGIEAVVLSHIHADHTGGLEGFLAANSKVEVYVPESFPKSFKKEVVSAGAKVVEVGKQVRICKDVYSTGQMGSLIKEQGLILRTKRGLIVITGCAHPGIVEMVRAAKGAFEAPVLLIIGGFHLKGARDDEIQQVISSLEGMGVKYAGPCHCTGEKARSLFAKRFGDEFLKVGVGRVVEIRDSK